MLHILLWLIGSGCLLVGCGPRPRPGKPPQHVLLVTVENLRTDHVTQLGHERRTTALLRPDQPSVLDIDSIALSGVAFARAYAPSADPELSLASLMGGAFPVDGGRASVAAAFPQGASSLAQAFHEAGFVTACFVGSRSFNSSGSTDAALAQGFQAASFHASDKETLGAAVAWLSAEIPKGGKHFTWIHLADIQAPFDGQPFTDRHSVQLPEGESHPDPGPFVAGLQAAGVRPSPADLSRLNDLYDGALVRTTELTNSFFFLYKHEFGVQGLWDDTLVALAGVSGCSLGEGHGGIAARNSLREEALRVPILFSHRNSLTGERIFGEVVELADLGATLRDWFRVDEGAPGSQSLLAITDSYVKRDFAARPALAVDGSSGNHSLRDERFRLVHSDDGDKLYDLQADPTGLHEVSGKFPEVMRAMQASAADRLQQLGLVQ